MEKTKLSSKGQVVIPRQLRATLGLKAGDEFVVKDTGRGILLTPVHAFPATSLEEVFGCLSYSGRPVSLEEMQAAIARGAREVM